MRPKLTIGMATFGAYEEVWFTLQALRMYHDLSEVELLVVDNNPTSDQLKNKVEQLSGKGCHSARYIPMASPVGTSPPRNRVMMEAAGAIVLQMDCHVYLRPGSLPRLLAWFEARPTSKDLLTGPILQDWSPLLKNEEFDILGTHFSDVWRGGMWGIWSQAWRARSGDTFTVFHNEGNCLYASLQMPQVPINPVPIIPYHQHEQALVEMGCHRLGRDINDEFDIPGQGLGLFACRKDAWPGFNVHCTGFGGEEMYIHEKVRRQGGRNICVGWLPWLHLFKPQNGNFPYPNLNSGKIRNYSLELLELSWSLDRMREHFNSISDLTDWERGLLKADYTYQQWVDLELLPVTQSPQLEIIRVPEQTIEAIYETVRAIPRDLELHFPKLKELASECDRVTEFSKRRESFIAFAAARPPRITSYNLEIDDPHYRVMASLRDAEGQQLTVMKTKSELVPSIANTELLFIDSSHTKACLFGELSKYAANVGHYIVMHDTILHNQNGEDGGPGLAEAIKEFTEQHKEWFICYHSSEEYGLTVLSRHPRDKPDQVIRIWPKGYGPGTELKLMLKEMGIETPPDCTCNQIALQMDELGPDGCEVDQHFKWIIEEMHKNWDRWGWKTKLMQTTKAGFKAFFKGLFIPNLISPLESFVKEAINRARVKETK